VKKLLVLVAAAVLLLAVSCDTKNIGTTGLPGRGPVVTVTVPAGMNGIEVHNWVVSWVGGTAPYTIAMTMGGGTTANVPAGTAAVSPFTQAFTMVNASLTADATYTYTIVVTDAQGQAGTATARYTVGPTLNQAPTIASAVYTAPNLVVTVNDPDDGETLNVTVTVPTGLAVDNATKAAAATGPLTATFVWSATDFVAGGSGTTTVTVSDGDATATQDVLITITAFPLVDDTLYAIPSPTVVANGDPAVGQEATGDAVTVQFLTGVPAHPFQYVVGIGLVVESDAYKVAQSFNVGAIGGASDAIDGIWAIMNPIMFILPPDGLIVSTDLGDGTERWDFNLTPVGGSDLTTASGALFNYQFKFAAPGVKHLSFQQVNVIPRTYYNDGVPTDYFWGDISNNAAPTITVQ
jgi:hypothetical protein